MVKPRLVHSVLFLSVLGQHADTLVSLTYGKAKESKRTTVPHSLMMSPHDTEIRATHALIATNQSIPYFGETERNTRSVLSSVLSTGIQAHQLSTVDQIAGTEINLLPHLEQQTPRAESTLLFSTTDDVKDMADQATKAWLPWNHPNSLISHESQKLGLDILVAGVTPILLLTGIPGNILSASVFVRQGLRQKVNLLLFFLALADLLFLTISALNCISHISSMVDAQLLLPTVSNPEVLTTFDTFHLMSSFLVTLISVDRCLTLTLPLRMRRLSWGQILTCIVIFTCVAVIANLPLYLINESGYRKDPITNLTYAYRKPTILQPTVLRIVPSTLLFISSSVIRPTCLCILLLCSIITSCKMRQVIRSRLEITSSVTRDDLKIFKMLLVVSVSFSLCTFPNIVLLALKDAATEFRYYGNHHNAFILTFHCSIVLQNVDASINFFIYLVMGSRFRQTLRELLVCQSPSVFSRDLRSSVKQKSMHTTSMTSITSD